MNSVNTPPRRPWLALLVRTARARGWVVSVGSDGRVELLTRTGAMVRVGLALPVDQPATTRTLEARP
jgi:hypothetical protein